ncbi:MAG: S26 family signal peptidase [Actinomycetales bacterium]|nr:S26 family signal peptidase [Actinomycetales bacterium]
MEPALANGEWWVVRRTRDVRPGDVVLHAHPLRPHLLVVKRISHEVDDGWWVLGDNLEDSEDSRTFGPVRRSEIVGRLWFRYGRSRLSG